MPNASSNDCIATVTRCSPSSITRALDRIRGRHSRLAVDPIHRWEVAEDREHQGNRNCGQALP
jgi:hypothetical protein